MILERPRAKERWLLLALACLCTRCSPSPQSMLSQAERLETAQKPLAAARMYKRALRALQNRQPHVRSQLCPKALGRLLSLQSTLLGDPTGAQKTVDTLLVQFADAPAAQQARLYAARQALTASPPDPRLAARIFADIAQRAHSKADKTHAEATAQLNDRPKQGPDKGPDKGPVTIAADSGHLWQQAVWGIVQANAAQAASFGHKDSQPTSAVHSATAQMVAHTRAMCSRFAKSLLCLRARLVSVHTLIAQSAFEQAHTLAQQARDAYADTPAYQAYFIFAQAQIHQAQSKLQDALAFYQQSLDRHPDPMLVQQKISHIRDRIARLTPVQAVLRQRRRKKIRTLHLR